MWLSLLAIVLPILLQLLTWLLSAHAAPSNPLVVHQLAKLRSLCRRIDKECGRLGIAPQDD